jgi:hypothetical protein
MCSYEVCRGITKTKFARGVYDGGKKGLTRDAFKDHQSSIQHIEAERNLQKDPIRTLFKKQKLSESITIIDRDEENLLYKTWAPHAMRYVILSNCAIKLKNEIGVHTF